MKKLFLLAALLFSVPAMAQNAPSGSTRVQGVPDGYGDPVQVTIVGSDGSGTGQVQGTTASGVATAGNPIKGAGTYNSTAITLTNGQLGELQLSSDGSLRTLAMASSATAADATANTSLTTFSQMSAQPGSSPRPLVNANHVFNGTSWDRQRGDTNGNVSLPGLSSTYWSYTSGASPILSNTTTAVTIKTAAGASVRNFIDSCQITTTAFGAAVPLAIRDGAGGTVIWALTVPTGGFLQPASIIFQMPLRSTANTLLEVVTTTANTSGTVTLSCQGHTGA